MLPVDHGFSASHALLAAALAGLLSTACSTAGSGAAGSSSTSIPASNGDTPIPATACDGGVSPTPQVTSSSVVADLTQDQFATQCAARNGIFEVQPHCGGSNSCRGMSYDSGTATLTEHSCRATNTCAGYSCVICG